MSEYSPFFTTERTRFFRPLNGKYREVIVDGLRSLYHRLYGFEADFGYQVTREDVRDLFVQALREIPVFKDEEDAEDTDKKSSDVRTKANGILQDLIEYGWLEKYVDKGAMLSTYRFTRAGKTFTETLVEFDRKGLQTRQRHVRNTKHALQAFLKEGDPFDLIDAADYAKRVASDLSDDIADLHERKRLMMKAAIEKAQIAIQELLDYMDNHFSPDLAIRLSADSIVRHRHHIREIIDKIKNWRSPKLKRAEASLKPLVPESERQAAIPITYQLLEKIERYLESAERVKLPELRTALESYVGRTTLMIKQATAMLAGLKEEQLAKTLDTLSQLSPAAQDQRLALMARKLGNSSVRLIAPNTLILRQRKRREISAEVKEVTQPTREERLKAALIEAQDNAFTVSFDDIRQEILIQMGEERSIRLSQIKVENAATFLAMSHAIEVGSVSFLKEQPRFVVIPTDERFNNDYLEAQDYIIQQVTDE